MFEMNLVEMVALVWLLVVKRGMRKIYVDVDGVMLDGSLDEMFKEMVKKEGIDNAIAWYEEQRVEDLEINIELLDRLYELKEKYNVKIIMWTNRGSMNIESTFNNLGKYVCLFDDYMFMEGKKGKSIPVDGIVIDNEEKYLPVGGGVWIETFMG